jgi:hypothetical protein
MAYTDFTIFDLKEQFGITEQVKRLFDSIQPLAVGNLLQAEIAFSKEVKIRSEKSRSEWIVAPVLGEIKRNNPNLFAIYSGETLIADRAKGLIGECDFILAADTHSFEISTPILTIVEAKKNDTDVGIPQCAAQLLGAKTYNERAGSIIPTYYGCVTTGYDWRFLALTDNSLVIDETIYRLDDIETLLGVFQHIFGYYKTILAKN